MLSIRHRNQFHHRLHPGIRSTSMFLFFVHRTRRTRFSRPIGVHFPFSTNSSGTLRSQVSIFPSRMRIPISYHRRPHLTFILPIPRLLSHIMCVREPFRVFYSRTRVVLIRMHHTTYFMPTNFSRFFPSKV